MVWSHSDPLPAVIEISHDLKSIILRTAKALYNGLIPFRLQTQIKTIRNLDKFERMLYAVMTFRGFSKKPQIRRTKNTQKPYRILFLCHGNIIRSPMAEAIFNKDASTKGLENLRAESAGIYAKQGHGADPRAVTAAQELGLCLKDHRARPINQEMVEKADAIFVMDYLNEAGLLGKFPKAWKKLYMLGSFTTGEKREKIEIEDPYNGDIDDIRRCYKTLRSAVQNLVMNIT
jgi:protein-tyrosine phosphatase